MKRFGKRDEFREGLLPAGIVRQVAEYRRLESKNVWQDAKRYTLEACATQALFLRM
jgi:hypothetical protein